MNRAGETTRPLHVDELADHYDLVLDPEDLEDVDTVGGLLAKRLGRVPIPGATVDVSGLRLVAGSATGRRNRVGTVLVTPLELPSQEGPEGDGDD